jgi:hypothetical protein
MVVCKDIIKLVSSRRLVSSVVSMYFTKIALIHIDSAVAVTRAFWVSILIFVALTSINVIFVSNDIFGGILST